MARLKHIFFTVCLVMFAFFVAVGQSRQDKFEQIENQKAAYITKQLKLSTSEAQRFFPIYNQYMREIMDIKSKKNKGSDAPKGRNSFRGGSDIIEYDSREVEIKKKYRSKFSEVVGQSRASQFFAVEQDFIRLLYKELDNRNNKH